MCFQLKKEYSIFKELASISGWGWDSENNRVQATDEQWDMYLLVCSAIDLNPNLADPK
jgi:hypothetical protein